MQLASITPRRWHAEFRFEGPIEFQATLTAFADVLAHCQAHELRGALVDFRATEGTLTALERMEIARMMAPEWTRGIILAVVVNLAQHLDERPGQLAAQNRGIRVREFTSAEAANDWLTAVLRDAMD